MTRTEVLARYRPIRAGICRVLRLAPAACRRADLTRAARQLAISAEHEPATDEAANMLVDVALFEPNQRGRRAFDRFLEERGAELAPADRALAHAMSGAFFSLFRLTGRHEAAGLWLEDLLGENRRLWLMDEALETSAPEGAVIGMRLFDAGPFHAGFGLVVAPDEETIEFCLAAKARSEPPPFRHSLAATLYGDQLRATTPPGPEDLALLYTLFEILSPNLTAPVKACSRPARARKRSHPRKR